MHRVLLQGEEFRDPGNIHLSPAATGTAEKLDHRFQARILDHPGPPENGRGHRQDRDRQRMQRISVLVRQLIGPGRGDVCGKRVHSAARSPNRASMSSWLLALWESWGPCS